MTATDSRMGPVPRTQPDADGREAYCAGLESLAAFLRANREVPVPQHGTRVMVALDGRTGVAAAASALGVDAERVPSMHRAVKRFGTVSYHAWAPDFGEGK